MSWEYISDGDSVTGWVNNQTGERFAGDPRTHPLGWNLRALYPHRSEDEQQWEWSPYKTKDEEYLANWNARPGSGLDKWRGSALDQGLYEGLLWGIDKGLLQQPDVDQILTSPDWQNFLAKLESRRSSETSKYMNTFVPIAIGAGMGLGAAGAAAGAGAGTTLSGAAGGAAAGGTNAALNRQNVLEGAATGAVLGGAAGYMGGGTVPADSAAAGPSGLGTTGVSAGAGAEFTGGLNPNITGSPGLNPNITGSPGLASYGVEGTSLASGYFPAESLAGPLTYGSNSLTSRPALTQTGTQAPPTSTGLQGILSNPQVLGMGAGALMGGLSSGGTQTGTIQTEEGIPDWLLPYVKPALDKYSTDLQNYQTDPYGIMPSAMNQFKNTINGMYLDPSTNKYLEDYFRLGAERIKGSLSPSFGHMQAFGQHSGYNEALSRGLGDFSVGLYGGAYEKERDRQNQMTAAAPGFLGQSAQAQFQPYSQYLTSVGSLGKSKETPFFQNPWSSILGGAMVGSQFGNAFK